MIFRAALFAFALATAALAAPPVASTLDFGDDPIVGSWKLNLEKSKPDPAAGAPKNSVRTYSAIPGGLRVAIRTVDADGSEHLTEYSFSYDGKQHPVTGTPDYDNVAVTRVARSESHVTLIQDGKALGQLTQVVSGDGGKLIITMDLTTNRGTAEHQVLVFDRE